MNVPALRDVQELFWKLLAAPEGVERGIAELEEAGEPAGMHVDAWIAGDDRLDARGRLDVYANMYFFRIRDAVAEDFPAVAKLVGPAKWHNLMTDYLLAHPSRHWSLRWVGDRMGEFLSTHPLAAERPDLPDLARLEWALADVFQQVDPPPFPRAALAAVPPEAWPGIRFSAATSVHLLRLGHEVGGLRDALLAGEDPDTPQDPPDPPAPDERPTRLLVWREDETGHHEEIDARTFAALSALLSGESFGAVCDLLASGSEDESGAAGSADAAEAAATLLADALGRGLLAGFSLENS